MNTKLSAKYYQENRKRVETKPCNRHQNLSNIEKGKK